MSVLKDAWDICKDIATGGSKLRQNRHDQQQRNAETLRDEGRHQIRTVEEAFQKEREAWRRQLDLAQTAQEKTRIHSELMRVTEEESLYHRASRDFILPQEMKDRIRALASRVINPGESPLEPVVLPADNEEQARLYHKIRDDLLKEIIGSTETREASQQHPEDASISARLGVGMSISGRYEEALTYYNRSLELLPDDPATLYNRGLALYYLSRLEDALTDYNRSLELRPDDPTTLTNRGATLSQLGHYDAALADYNRSLGLRPNHPDTTYNLACGFSLLGSYQETLEWLSKALSLDSKYREMSQTDDDFAPLKSDPTFGPKFQRLVTGSH